MFKENLTATIRLAWRMEACLLLFGRRSTHGIVQVNTAAMVVDHGQIGSPFGGPQPTVSLCSEWLLVKVDSLAPIFFCSLSGL